MWTFLSTFAPSILIFAYGVWLTRQCLGLVEAVVEFRECKVR